MISSSNLQALEDAARYAGLAILAQKAVGPKQFSQALAREMTLRDALFSAHRDASEAAIDQAVRRARGTTAGGKEAVDAIMRDMSRVYQTLFVGRSQAALQSALPQFYRLGKEAAWRKATGASRAELEADRPKPPKVVKQGPLSRIPVRFDLVDDDAIRALTDHQLFWAGRHWDRNVSDRIAEVTRQVMVEQGLSGAEAARTLGPALQSELDISAAPYLRPATFKPPPGWKGSASTYLTGLASNAATVGRAYGSTRAFEQVGITRIEIVNPDDERTCPRCRLMDGKVFLVPDAAAQVASSIAARSPEAVKSVHPWRSVKWFRDNVPRAGHISDEHSSTLVKAGVILPPFHYLCRCVPDVSADAEIRPEARQALLAGTT